MAISLKTAGTWAEYTTDLQTVTIPGTPAAGDRMFLFVAWKDYAITLATPSGWTAIVNSYADGTTGTGNGTGSMSQAIFYRDWQSGDANPTLDFSTTTNLLAEAVVMLWQKAGGESWAAPRYVTSPHSFSTSSVYENADATIDIGDGSVVMCQVATRDDSATFTRTTTSIKDSGALITWNGNYVESPATHYTTITGNDHSGDLGHRFVTTGASGVTLQAEAVESAADSGSLVWVVQNVFTSDPKTATPGVASLATSLKTPSVTINNIVRPGVASLVTSLKTPKVTVDNIVRPGVASLVTSLKTPSVIVNKTVIPGTASLVLSPFAPDVSIASNSTTVTPGTASLALTAFAPTVTTPRLVVPGTASLNLTGFTPSVIVNNIVTPGTASLVLDAKTPTVTASDNKSVTPGTASLALTAFAPTVVATTGISVTPGTASLVLTGYAPIIIAGKQLYWWVRIA